MKRVLCILLLVLSGAVAPAKGPHFTYGLEWGYTATFFKHADYNFICSEGYRINETHDIWWYYSNGAILANAGVDLTRKLNVSAYSGLLGVYSHRWVIPAEVRVRYCPAGNDRNGPVFHAGGGATFPTSTLTETAGRGLIGGGYRFSIFRSMSVDFLLSFNLTFDHDLITDPDTHGYVPHSAITTNMSEYYAVCASIALNF